MSLYSHLCDIVGQFIVLNDHDLGTQFDTNLISLSGIELN